MIDKLLIWLTSLLVLATLVLTGIIVTTSFNVSPWWPLGAFALSGIFAAVFLYRAGTAFIDNDQNHN